MENENKETKTEEQPELIVADVLADHHKRLLEVEAFMFRHRQI